jgi:hypothetical protein
VENYEPTTNCNPNKVEKMALDRPYPKKTTGSIEKSVLEWNPQGARRRGRPKKTWKRTIEDEAMETGKTWSEVKRLAVDRTR